MSQLPVPAWAADFKRAVRSSLASSVRYSGPPLLRLDKRGAWVVGPEEEEVPEGTRVIVWADRIEHGFIAWSSDEARKLGEVTAPLGQPLPRVEDLPPVNGGAWRLQYLLEMSPLDDLSIRWSYRPTSVGGIRAVERLLAEIVEWLDGVEANPAEAVYLYPVVELNVDSYQHKNRSYGHIFVPVLTVLDWAAEDGSLRSAALKRAKLAPPTASKLAASQAVAVASAVDLDDEPAPGSAAAAAPEGGSRRWRVRNARS